MADPLSLTFGVAGLLSLGLHSIEYLFKYYSKLKDRNTDIARTTDKLEDLLQSLRRIDGIVQARRWRPNETTMVYNVEIAISRCEAVIKELASQVSKFKDEPTGTTKPIVRAAMRRVAYPVRSDTLRKLVLDIEYFRGNLLLAFDALQAHEQQQMQADLNEVTNIVKKTQEQQLSSNLRSWFRAPDPSIDFNAACSKRHAGTGQWFTKSPSFASWLEKDNSFLWLYGFAGCGKSVLCSTAVQHAFRHQRQTQACSATAYFFFVFSDKSKQNASALLRSLLLQICGQISGFEASMQQLKNSTDDGMPTLLTFLEYLRQAITQARGCYILLDGLDECPSGDQRNEVLEVIQTIRGWALPGLHMLVTSRDYLDIRQELNVDKSEMLALQNDAVLRDIQSYVDHQVDNDRQLLRWRNHREIIKSHLTQNANGMFRWVDCQLGTLRKCLQSPKHLQKCLQSLPMSLDATYERILTGIDTEIQSEARRLLTLLCFSSRPMTVVEVLDALAIDTDQGCFDSESRLASAEDLLRICPGLIEIYESPIKDHTHDFDHHHDQNRDDSNRNRTRCFDELWMHYERYHERMNYPHLSATSELVRIAHFSVQEYLLSERIQSGYASVFALSAAMEHQDVSKMCLIYLCNREFVSQPLTEDLIKDYPLAMFAAEYWYEHYSRSDSKKRAPLEAWISVLMGNDEIFERWVRLYDIDNLLYPREIFYDEKVKAHGTQIYYLTLLGLEKHLAVALSNPTADVNSRGDRYETALLAATHIGYESIVDMLLERGAQPNLGQYDGDSALHVASVLGHDKIVQMLLEHGAEINAKGRQCSTALYAASAQGHEKVVQILLHRGANVNDGGRQFCDLWDEIGSDCWTDEEREECDYGPPLHIASVRGHEKVVQMLVDGGADVNEDNLDFGTALHVALHEGHEKVVQVLLREGATVTNDEIQEYMKGSGTLTEASAAGYKKIVQMLLDHGTEVNGV